MISTDILLVIILASSVANVATLAIVFIIARAIFAATPKGKKQKEAPKPEKKRWFSRQKDKPAEAPKADEPLTVF